MLYYKNRQFNICPFIAHYKAHGKPEFKYTNDKQWWIEFVNRWWHHTDLSFTDVNPTQAQQTRLDEVNAAPIPEGFQAEASNYVETGELLEEPNEWFTQLGGGEVIPPLTMSATLNKTIITADNTDTLVATVQLKRGEELTSEKDGTTWYVPVLGIDGVQYDLLKFVVTNGEATASWTTSRKGIYTVRIDMIRPKTTLTLPENIEVIAE